MLNLKTAVCLLLVVMWGGDTSGRAIIETAELAWCALTPSGVPESWRPMGKIHETLDQQDW